MDVGNQTVDLTASSADDSPPQPSKPGALLFNQGGSLGASIPHGLSRTFEARVLNPAKWLPAGAGKRKRDFNNGGEEVRQSGVFSSFFTMLLHWPERPALCCIC